MREKIIAHIVGFSKTGRSSLYKGISLLCGVIFFMALLPAFLIWIGTFADNLISFRGSFLWRVGISVLCISAGIALLSWATLTQIRIGRGTPAPNAPTSRLIAAGPYRYSRNPIELGAIIYYFGLGSLMVSYTAGAVGFLIALLGGSLYHKMIEERELEARFGKEYIEYRKKVPFLIPGSRRR